MSNFTPSPETDFATPGVLRCDRLELLCQFLDQLEPEKFYFGTVIEHDGGGCGTIGCAVGWTPAVFPSLVQWVFSTRQEPLGLAMPGTEQPEYFEVGSLVFGMPLPVAEYLFSPMGAGDLRDELPQLTADAFPKDVAQMLRQFITLTRNNEIPGLIAGE